MERSEAGLRTIEENTEQSSDDITCPSADDVTYQSCTDDVDDTATCDVSKLKPDLSPTCHKRISQLKQDHVFINQDHVTLNQDHMQLNRDPAALHCGIADTEQQLKQKRNIPPPVCIDVTTGTKYANTYMYMYLR